MTDAARNAEGGHPTVTVDGDLTATTVGRWRAVLAELANAAAPQVVVDLMATAIVDSSGIGLLLAAHNSFTRNGGSLAVVNASPDVAALFRAMRLDRHFAVSGR
jgi:serine/threonine-protein kinase RsbW